MRSLGHVIICNSSFVQVIFGSARAELLQTRHETPSAQSPPHEPSRRQSLTAPGEPLAAHSLLDVRAQPPTEQLQAAASLVTTEQPLSFTLHKPLSTVPQQCTTSSPPTRQRPATRPDTASHHLQAQQGITAPAPQQGRPTPLAHRHFQRLASHQQPSVQEPPRQGPRAGQEERLRGQVHLGRPPSPAGRGRRPGQPGAGCGGPQLRLGRAGPAAAPRPR